MTKENMTQEEINARTIITRGLLVAIINEGYEEYINDKTLHLDLINSISFLIDQDPFFFSFSDVSKYDFQSLGYYVTSDYRDKYNDNSDLCNEVIGKLNGFNAYSPKEKESMRVLYMTEQQMDRDRNFSSLDDMFYSILYDSALFHGIVSGEIEELDNYDNIIDSTIYLYNNYNSFYDDEAVSNNSVCLMDMVIGNSKKFSPLKKDAKTIKKVLLKEKLEY